MEKNGCISEELGEEVTMTKLHSIKFQRTNKGKYLTIPETVSKKVYIGIIQFENIKYL